MCAHVGVSVCVCALVHEKVHRQLAEVVLSFYDASPGNRTWIVHKAWWQALLPAEPSCLHPKRLLNKEKS